jgi:hypothetical protein
MNPWSRFFLRLRQRALRLYELGMLALLVTAAVVATLPGGAHEDAAAAQCGNIQSSTVVMHR